jgi:hypothetical protein
VLILSNKVPVTGRFFKESVKVCTPKSPASADDPALDLPSAYILTHRPGIQPEHFRRFAESEKVLSNRFYRDLFFLRHGLPLESIKVNILIPFVADLPGV